MTKIEDIAQAAGVSIATVSRVLNNSGRVAPATRDAVLRAAQQLGRSVSPAVSRRRVLIAYPCYAQELIEPLINVAAEYNIAPLNRMVPLPADAAELTADLLQNGGFDGALIIDGILDRDMLASLEERMAVVECRSCTDPARSVVSLCDDTDMGYQLGRHLVERGKRRVAFVGQHEPVPRDYTLERLRGLRAALAEDGLELMTQYTYDTVLQYHMDEGLLPRLRQDAGRVWDALIFSAPVDAALLLKNQLLAAGIRVGPDVALACFDESPMTQYNGITTMCQPAADIARGAIFLLDSLMAGRLRPTGGMRLQYRAALLARESTGA